MRQLGDWLEKLGMSEYAQRFAENDIDFTILGDLTDQDLKDLGVASLGHRRKLLRAIAALAITPEAEAMPAIQPLAPKTMATAAPPPPISAPVAAVEAAGERRYLTVMFCDLVGSTGISAQLDAEEWRDLVGAYIEAASAAITEMGGHVAKKLGDGLLALFGYPVAHENDTERAVRAALAIQRALTELNRKNASSGKPELKPASASKPVRRWSMRPARFTATSPTSRRGCRRWPRRARFWSRRGCSARSRGSSLRKSAAVIRSKVCRNP